jgi:hypothetical protein
VRRIVWVWALLAAGPCLAGQEIDDQQRLQRGEIVIHTEPVEGSKTPRITATAIFDVPPEQLWPLIDRCGDYARTMIHIREAVELERNGSRVLCRSTVNLPFPLNDLTATTEAQHRIEPGRSYERSWKLYEGPYKDNSGRWLLTALEGETGTRTLVLYEMHADPNISLPGWLQRIGARKSIPDLFEKLRSGVKPP